MSTTDVPGAKATATLLLHGERCAAWHFARVAA